MSDVTENNRTQLPEYAKDDCYKIVCSFAQKMGLEIIYKNYEELPDGVLAFADVYDLEDGQHKCIIMPHKEDRIVLFGKEPAAVLAHEIVHYLVEDFYTDCGDINVSTVFPLRLMMENDCDRMGLALYLLAEAIAAEGATI